MKLTKSLALFLEFYNKALDPGDLDRKRGQRQVIMAFILWAIDVPHIPRQRDAKM